LRKIAVTLTDANRGFERNRLDYNSYVAAASTLRQKWVVTLTPRNELILWIVCTFGAGVAFLTSHTFYVTAGTSVSGAVLLGITVFLFWMRFRRRQTPRTKGLTVTSNTALALLSLVAVLYLLGVATWYE
jgi:hypothetical protein